MKHSTTVPRGQKPPEYAAVEVGMPLGPAELVADEHMVRAYSFAQDDYNPWYYGDSPFGKPIVPPGALANELLLLYYYQLRQSTCNAIHAAEQLRFHGPLFHDEIVNVTGRYVDKYMKRGKGYVVAECEAKTEDGRLILSHRGTEIIEGDTAAIGNAAGAPAQPPESSVPILRKTARADQVAVFSNIGKQQKNIHNDAEFARTVGLAQPVVQGMQQACYLVELGVRTFGSRMLVAGQLDVRFIAPLYVEAVVEAGGSPVEDPKASTLLCWVRDTHGGVTTVGEVGVPSQSH